MEESLKARLIGAAVLVALAVLLVPEVLSGRKAAEPVAEEGAGPRGTRTFTIELGQGPGHAARTPTTSILPAPAAPAAMTADSEPVRADKGRDTEPPAQSPGEMAAGALATEPEATPPVPLARDATPPQPAPVSVETAPTASAAPPAGPKASAVGAPGGGWAVQVGAFGSADAARKLVKELGAAGYRAFVSPVSRGGRTLFRVRVGPEGDRASAEELLPRLKARGLPATIVRND